MVPRHCPSLRRVGVLVGRLHDGLGPLAALEEGLFEAALGQKPLASGGVAAAYLWALA